MTVTVVDLFCGAGGFSTGAALALEELGRTPGEDVELHAINHWGVAIETHEANHPWAEHYHSGIDDVEPLTIANPDAGDTVELMVGGPECTHHSNARGGKPVDDQKREPAWNVLTWVQKLRPETLLIENVKEFAKWGPIEDGQSTNDASVFDAWVNALNAMGYAVDHRVLTCADYGDPTSRERLFVIARRNDRPSFPSPTHSNDPDDGLEPWRTAAEIIDWSDPGTSLWTRDLEHARVQPLSQNTMERIAEGIRRHCDLPRSLADALASIGPAELKQLREHVVPAEYAPYVAEVFDGPFLVRTSRSPASLQPSLTKYYGANYASPVGEPLDTVTAGGNKYGLVEPGAYVLGQHSNSIAHDADQRPAPTITKTGNLHLFEPDAFCLRQQSGGVPAAVSDPLPTVASGGAIGLAEVESWPLVQPKNGLQGGLHSNALYPPSAQPVHTLTSEPRAMFAEPALVRYSHGGAVLDVNDPMPTIATERGGVFALSSPYLCPMYNPRPGQRPRTRSIDRPLMTVPASKSPAGIATPFIRVYNGKSDITPITEPLPTAPATDRFALCVPEAWPWGLDVRYRMLKPSELKQAQGFPESYELAGSTKENVTEQIGNAVPVNTAKALCKHLLDEADPSLSTFGGGLAEDSDYEPPSYAEVVGGDD